MTSQYLTQFKFPMFSMIDQENIDSGTLFVEQIAEQVILASKDGSIISAEACDILDQAGTTMIHIASSGAATDEQYRIFDKIYSAVHLSSAQRDLKATIHDSAKAVTGSEAGREKWSSLSN